MSDEITHAIAIDGKAGTGKSTLAEELARQFGCPFLSGGHVMRKIVHEVRCGNLDGSEASIRTLLARPNIMDEFGDPALQSHEIGLEISQKYRTLESLQPMIDFSRNLAMQHPLIVMDGRIAGTVIFPNAWMKFYLKTDMDERVRRSMVAKPNSNADALAARDAAEADQLKGKMEPAPDAIHIDTTRMHPDRVVKTCLHEIHNRLLDQLPPKLKIRLDRALTPTC